MTAIKFNLSNDEVKAFREMLASTLWDYEDSKDNAIRTLWLLLHEVYDKLNKVSTFLPTKKSFRINATQSLALHTFMQKIHFEDDYSEVLRMRIFETIDKKVV